MRKIINTLSLMLLALLLFSACEDDNKTSPEFKYVRPTSADASDSLLTIASMGQTIAIIGEGFQDVVAVYFNDQKAKLNPVYVTSTSIIVVVPGSIPEVVTNTITLKTSTGEKVEYGFTTQITSPSVKSISCEWAKDASEATLYGAYFFAKEDGSIDVLFPGNLQAEIVAFSDEAITVKVPVGAMQGTIVVSNDYGSGKSAFTFRDNEGIFIDGENVNEWNGWGLSDFDTADGIDGAYVKFAGATGAWAWPANQIQMLYVNPTGASLASEGEVADYALKFECKSSEWHDTPMLLWFDTDGTHNVDGSEAQYHWSPYDKNGVSENYVTDGWITVVMPLSDFVYSKDETETDRKIASLDDLKNLNIMWFGEAFETTTEFGLDLRIDNLRIVKVN